MGGLRVLMVICPYVYLIGGMSVMSTEFLLHANMNLIERGLDCLPLAFDEISTMLYSD